MSIKVNGKTIAGSGGAVKRYSPFSTYMKDVIVLESTENGIVIYKSLHDYNTSNPLTDTDWWQEIPLEGKQGNGLDLFDVIEKDHILSYEETKGLEKLGGIVYKTPKLNEYYGYPDFYETCLTQYKESTKSNNFYKSHITRTGLTDNKGLLTGFSASGYATLPSAFSPGTNTWEWQFKLNIGTLGTLYIWGTKDYKGPLIGVVSSKFSIWLSSNGTSWNIGSQKQGTHVVTVNTDYWVKLKFTGSQYILSYSTDGKTFTNDIVVDSTAVMAGGSKPVLGYGWTSSPLTSGSIDLNSSYIKIGDSTWWKGTTWYNTYQHSNGHYFYDVNNKNDKDVIDDIYNTNKVAWYYGIDEQNECIHLPRNDFYFKGSTSTDVGKFVKPGLPNITGTLGAIGGSPSNATGAFYDAGTSSALSNSGEADGLAGFDASRSSKIYGSSTTVQPASVNVIYYMVVGSVTIDISHVSIVQQTNKGIKDIEDARVVSIQDIINLSNDSIASITDLANEGLSEIQKDTKTATDSLINTRDNSIQQIINETTPNIYEAEKWAIGNDHERPEGSAKYWAELAKEVISLQIGDIGQCIFPIDESKGLRRYLNGSVVDINDTTRQFIEKLEEMEETYPSLFCTNEEWESIATNSQVGQCGKFSWTYGTGGITVTKSIKRGQWKDDIPILVGEDGTLSPNVLIVDGQEVGSNALAVREGYSIISHEQLWYFDSIDKLPVEMTLEEIQDDAANGSMLEDQYYAYCTTDGYLYQVVPAATYIKNPNAWLVVDNTGKVYYDLTNVKQTTQSKSKIGVRLPKIVMPIQGLTDMSKLGEIVQAGLPNITGWFAEGSGDNAGTGNDLSATQVSGAFTKSSYGSGKTLAATSGSYDRGQINIDASRSSAVYGRSTTVQPEAIQYPYFIQIATKQEQYEIINDFTVTSPYYYGMYQYTDKMPNNACWLKSAGQWNKNTVYRDYYNWLVRQYNYPTEFYKKPNIEIIGTMNYDNGIINYVGDKSYGKIPIQLNLGNNFEIILSIKTGPTLEVIHSCFCGLTNPYIAVGALDNTSYPYTFGYNIGDGTNWLCDSENNHGTNIIKPDTEYKVKLVYNGTRYTAYITTDIDVTESTNWIQDWSLDSTTQIPVFTGVIGNGRNLDIPWNVGHINLEKCCIRKDNKVIWQGTTVDGLRLNTESYTDTDFVIDKSTQSFRLPLLTKERILVASKKGTNWYNLYNDGWLEQGGIFDKGSLAKDTTSTVKFNLPFKDTSYTLLACSSRNDNAASGINNQVFVNYRTADQFIGRCYGDGNSQYIQWTAYGYIDNQRLSNFNIGLYYYIGEALQNPGLINIGRIQEQFIDKCDRDLSNCTKPHVVETYKSGNSWYRKWSDGWLEQGGQYGVDQSTTIAFVKSFTDIPTVSICSVSARGAACYEREAYPNTVTKSDFKVTNSNAGGVYCKWYAFGY